MKMIDMGYKPSNEGKLAEEKPTNKTRTCYPSFNIYDHAPKELFKAEVGDTIKVVMECKVARKSINEDVDKNHNDIGFDILKIGIVESIPKSEDELTKEVMRQSGAKEE
jgi:hypothetical protein